jgi:hypothetical protein
MMKKQLRCILQQRVHWQSSGLSNVYRRWLREHAAQFFWNNFDCNSGGGRGGYRMLSVFITYTAIRPIRGAGGGGGSVSRAQMGEDSMPGFLELLKYIHLSDKLNPHRIHRESKSHRRIIYPADDYKLLDMCPHQQWENQLCNLTRGDIVVRVWNGSQFRGASSWMQQRCQNQKKKPNNRLYDVDGIASSGKSQTQNYCYYSQRWSNS